MFAEVVIDVASSETDRVFDYEVGAELENTVKAGSLVTVPFGSKTISGFVLFLKNSTTFEKDKIKQIIKVENFCVSEQHLKLAQFMREKFFLRHIDVLRLFLPPTMRKGVKARKEKEAQNFALSEKQQKIVLTKAQQSASEKIENAKKPILLFGVTGCGKTEIYLKVIENALKKGKSAIMLVPEISLTPQIAARFKNRFGSMVAIIHSGLDATERRTEFKKILSGSARVVVGARSAIFAPVKNLGIVIVDEEHDSSYVSETNPRYFTHDVARNLCQNFGAALVFGSATPSIESFYKAKNGEYELITISERVGTATMPSLEIVDMCSEIKNGNNGIFSARTSLELSKITESKKQAVVFINRRGYSSFVRCFDCGHIPKCTGCDVSLVWHKEDGQLKCHFCGKRFKAVNVCEKCGGIIRTGAVGSERVAAELKTLFPSATVLRMDNDTIGGDKTKYIEILEKFKNAYPAILVGTQMVSKGHDFDNVDLSVVVDADLSLHFSDYRSVERTFALITQVAGRSGRKSGNGVCLVQTYTPRHYVYHFAKTNNYAGFYEKEINIREVTKFPPFAAVCRVLITSENESIAKNTALKIFGEIKKLALMQQGGFIYCDVMKSPIKRIKNKFRFQVLMRLKNETADEILKEINLIVCNNRVRGAIIFLENNPQNLA